MSAGGINTSQPLVGLPPTAGSGFAPVAGQQAGSVQASGGLVEDGLPRTAAIATNVATNAYGANTAYDAASATVAGQQVVDPATLQPGAATKGPAAWSEQWAKAFKDAGAPSEIIQQLTFTGAMGADEAQLGQMLAQIKGEIDTELAKFAHEHPEEFKKLRGNPAVDRSMIAQIAAASNAGQLPKEQLDQMVDSIGKSQGKMLFDMLVKPMIVWSLIPGWGALRLGFAPFTGGKDPLTGEKMFADPMSTTFTILAGVGGAMTLFNNVKGAMQVAQGHSMIKAGGDAATIAAHQGVDNLSFGRKLWSYVPGTQLNQQVAGISRVDDIKAGILSLSDDVIEGTKYSTRELAQNAFNKMLAGDVPILGDSASKWTKMGYQPNSRGFLMGHIMGKKGAISTQTMGSRLGIVFDGRTTGKVAAAHLASIGAEFADDAKVAVTSANGVKVDALLKSRIFGGLDPSDLSVMKNVKDSIFAHASTQLLDAGAISRPTGLAKIIGNFRPGALQDSIWAADNLAAGTLGKANGWAAIPKMAKFGLGGLLAAGAGYMMFVKPQMDAKKQAEAQAAEQAAGGAQGQAPGTTGGAAPGAGSLSAEDQAVLQQFAALPADQQAQIIQQQYAQLQQAMQTPNLTAEQQQQLAAAQSELQLLMQVANGGAGAATGGGAAQPQAAVPGAVQPQAAMPAAGAGTPQFTAQGLGLA
jgi:hypothetical protein